MAVPRIFKRKLILLGLLKRETQNTNLNNSKHPNRREEEWATMNNSMIGMEF